ncbi:NAD(P)-dependent alcohol dehydrogenase [Spongiibacter nanhainus]|uniref:NAD(P)-dependent alcohol dehydrogenase n=1 Tax=Spongiibacter nanhainus TaxID=2794344 RepID=A0A7T4UR57_9GAMM|nr:NAD(P)-dependent alcohol dehydrogenase [Spongiibacter nanhainus]QQD19192.1 NAD(P)-dependent alcohol dehydrogenase [Spongiibacter nanhainus]
MRIKAAVATQAQQPFVIEDLNMEPPRRHEVRVRVLGVGICHTDIISKDQQIPVELPAVLGHEGAGIVEAVGEDVTKVKVGDQVVMSYLSCGECPSCNEHAPSYCHQFAPLNFLGRRPDGSAGLSRQDAPVSGRFFGQSSFASHALVDQRNVVKVDIDAQRLPLVGALGCGFQTGAGTIMNALDCQSGDNVVIVGGGAVGMSAVIAASIRGCHTVLIEPNSQRRALAVELGAAAALAPDIPNLKEALSTHLSGGISKLFDTTGIAPAIEQFLPLLAPRATVGLVAAAEADSAIKLDITHLVLTGITVKGILEGDADPDSFIPELIDHIKAGRFPVEKICKTFPLEQINKAIHEQKSAKFVKAVLIP